ncbi:MAG: hypothetical protein OXG88_06025 [Gammaproteobacteria bacterium]|nr:hypothetical protein [Gammaproteobacteria bacterium]
MTKDHIPPKCLFATPSPNAITVPCCRKCNESASKDDEYFRLVCASNYNGHVHPEQRELFPKFIGSLNRKVERASDRKVRRELELPEEYSAIISMFKDARQVYIENETGIIEPTLAWPIDVDRINRVVSRIIKGLTWKENGKRLSRKYEINIHYDGFHYLDDGPPNLGRKRIEVLSAMLRKQPTTVGNDVFSYWHSPTTEDKSTGTWILEFYKQTRFYCFVNKATSAS